MAVGGGGFVSRFQKAKPLTPFGHDGFGVYFMLIRLPFMSCRINSLDSSTFYLFLGGGGLILFRHFLLRLTLTLTLSSICCHLYLPFFSSSPLPDAI